VAEFLPEAAGAVWDFLVEWWVVAIPGLLGFLSGGQQIYAKQGSDLFTILRTGWGTCYWLSRIVIPAGGYLAWYAAQSPPEHSVWVAVAFGLGAEAILRSKIYLGTRSTAAGNQEDLLKGVFDLIEWWQGFALNKANVSLATRKQKLVDRLTANENDFANFAQRVKNRANSLDDEQRNAILNASNELLAAFQKAGGARLSAETQRDFCAELSYKVLRLVGRRGLTTLVSPS
jgi:hypothetical protein